MRTFILIALVFAGLASPLQAAPEEHLEIHKIVLATNLLMIREQQVIEVHVRNKGEKDYPLLMKLVLTLPNRTIITFAKKPFLAKAYTDTPVIISYPISGKGHGDYTVSARIYDRRDKPLVTAHKERVKYFYALDPKIRKTPPKRRRGQRLTKEEVEEEKRRRILTESKKEETVTFDPPDLKWGRVEMIRTSVLRGETAHIRLYLLNDGGDIAKNVEYDLLWFFTQRPRRKIKFYRGKVALVAPGEMKVLELPITIPSHEQPGQYSIHAILDADNRVSEIDETNNEHSSDQELNFGDIAMVFPENNHSFAEEGLFQFEWRSSKYNQFKVQISADPTFTNDGDYFEMPKNEKWTPSFQLNPMRGEMPTLALSLMDQNETDHLFWRVVAKDAKGKTTESQPRRFYITLKPKN